MFVIILVSAMALQSVRRVSSILRGTNIEIVRYSTAIQVNGNEVVEEVKPFKDIPGPISLPVIGQLHHYLPNGELYKLEGQDLIFALYKKYGEIVRVDSVFGRPPMVFLTEPGSIAEIMRSENWYPKRPSFLSLEYYKNEYKKPKDKCLGLIADHGEGWRKVRSIVNPVLLQPKNMKVYETGINEITEEMIQRMKSKLDENNIIKDNLVSEFNLWALESTGLVALGCRLNCLDPNLPPGSPAYQLTQCVVDIFTKFDALNNGINLWRYFPTKLFKRAMKTYEMQENLAHFFIRKAMLDDDKNKTGEKGVLQKLMEIDENVAHVMATDMMLGGVDTVANTIVATLYLLANNTEKQEKLREELNSKTESKKYLKACIKEALRIKPIVSAIVRQVNKDYDILGFRIPKDTMVFCGHHQLSMKDEQFPRAQEFVPERWIVDKGHPLHYAQADPLVYNPFGFGARSCIGKRLADLELETMMSKLITNFKVEWFGPPIRTEAHFLNNMAPPHNFRFITIV